MGALGSVSLHRLPGLKGQGKVNIVVVVGGGGLVSLAVGQPAPLSVVPLATRNAICSSGTVRIRSDLGP